MDQKKWVDITLGLAGLAVFWIIFNTINTLVSVFNVNLLSNSPVGVDVLGGLLAGVVVFIVLRKNAKVFLFTEEVINELSKVTWPVRKETFVSGAVVLVMVGIASLIMSLFDSVWGSLAQKILN